MDESFDLPCEPCLSNTILKNRPMPLARTKMQQRKNIPSQTIGLDDPVPLESKFLNQMFNINI